MARIRSIKPEFFRHEGLQDLEAANPGAFVMLAFAGLWAVCDRAGRFQWKPRTLKLDILPFLEFDMARTLDLLASKGFVVRYEVGGEPFGVIPTWTKHQTGESLKNERIRFPEPPEATQSGPGTFPDKSGKHPGPDREASPKDAEHIPDESGSGPPRSLEREHGKGKEVLPPLPPAGSGGSAEPKAAPPKRASWTQEHSPDVVAAAREICGFWPDPKRDFQPDGKTPVPGISAPEVAVRLSEARKSGAELPVCIAIAKRAVEEFREGGKWIKAPQHFFGASKDAPFRAYYQAHVTNQAHQAHLIDSELSA